MVQTIPERETPPSQAPQVNSKSSVAIPLFLMMVIGIALFALSFVVKTIFFPVPITAAVTETTMSSLRMTPFDVELAKRIMDKNNDGKCDVCGMDVQQCIDSGQLECTMGGKAGIGILNSLHIHADWKIYINGQSISLSDQAHMTRMQVGLSVSSFIHVDEGQAPEKTGDVLHMHAANVPLWIFFESVGLKFNETCLLFEQSAYCNDETHSLKFYINGKQNGAYQNYVFKDQDKLLISYGLQDENVQPQLDSITNFALMH